MKRLLYLLFAALFLYGCSNKKSGDLIGVQDRAPGYSVDPYGMVIIPQGSFVQGAGDEDIPWSLNAETKTVSVAAFWMDDTEITNNEYRQFVYWVRDSIARLEIATRGNLDIEETRMVYNKNSQDLREEPFFIKEEDLPLNWEYQIPWDGSDPEMYEPYTVIKEKLFYPNEERFTKYIGMEEIDTRKLVFEYSWVDYQQAAQKFLLDGKVRRRNFSAEVLERDNYQGDTETNVFNAQAVEERYVNRKSFIQRNRILVYPDTLVWVGDFSFAYNEPYAATYFTHPNFDEYPVVGVTWMQATAFSVWRTNLMNSWLVTQGNALIHDYKLPTEAEWEYAARGGLEQMMYPWGGYYTRDSYGCFLANFKNNRGDYTKDGDLFTSEARKFHPNDYGLYDMAGNVAEWTRDAFDESSYSYTHDMNPAYEYNAQRDDQPVLKRKVIRGGSWKDIAFFLQNGTRTFEYQDTAKSYIGFRCVRAHMGSQPAVSSKSSVY
ncbi:MAG: SUMF1/EgtB/PvdO family nonheme iron enzyme [Salinivirgaceae bacterium]|nr:SUMF1/EgtB/PvdO family nonheme iron enzyme [Salinivirgaceae bacterium]MDD4746120.1 SUMF1/EgtB/PvdO family nonheme iron enzyme [Salinivirgaceae bacterium]MDY0279848.1 SUMF1/EgtB/PvdO family nonheme iron enzyme [Salinivirgaceae bacterium]